MISSFHSIFCIHKTAMYACSRNPCAPLCPPPAAHAHRFAMAAPLHPPPPVAPGVPLPVNMARSPPEGWYHGRPEVQLAARKARDDLVKNLEVARDERNKETEKLEVALKVQREMAAVYMVPATLNPGP